MAPPPRRRTAMDVTDEAEGIVPEPEPEPEQHIPTSTRKRKTMDSNDRQRRDAKRLQPLDEAWVYKAPPNVEVIIETSEYTAPGEDVEAAHGKPFRVLTNFSVFDPCARDALVGLDAVEQDADEADARHYVAAGVVLLPDANDEDYGQEDEGDYLHLDVLGVTAFGYFEEQEIPIYLETKWAFYELRGPAASYETLFKRYLAPRRLARFVLRRARSNPNEDWATFRFETEYSDEALDASNPRIREALEDNPAMRHLDSVPFVHDLLLKKLGEVRSRRRPQRRPQLPLKLAPIGNPDLALLRAENQVATTVTPLIAQLAHGLFTEDLHVLGAQPKPPKQADVEARKAKELRYLRESINLVLSPGMRKAYPTDSDQRKRDPYYTEATIGGELYKSGDFVLIRRAHDPNREAPAPSFTNIGENATLSDYFWFARIIYFIIDRGIVHVQWLEHGLGTIMGEMADPQELFMLILCENQDVSSIVRKIKVSSVVDGGDLPHSDLPGHFFVRFIYNGQPDGSFTSIDKDELIRCFGRSPPENCVRCARSEQYNILGECTILPDRTGVTYQGFEFHKHEFFLYKNEKGSGPAFIGQLTEVQRESRGGVMVVLRKVGRMAIDMRGIDFGGDVPYIYPERHVFLTHETTTVPGKLLIRPVHVYAYDFFQDLDELKEWIDYSPYNFYCTHRVSSLSGSRKELWAKRVEVLAASHVVCGFPTCRSDLYRPELREQDFEAQHTDEDYTCLDLFGGTGAFSHGIAEGSRGLLKPTHLVEITPSAARTVQKNSDAVVYCQDANTVLRYFVKLHEGHEFKIPNQFFGNGEQLPPPLKPGKMRAIFAGLPCQSHSGLNMFRKAEDPKSNLILTTLSYVDFFRPHFFFLENVPGFLRYNLLAKQESRYRVEGGIEMGGIKLLLRALLDMKYQVRYFLLQAGNYGAPQSRVRFFLVAALHGHPLPEIPQPTHDFEVVHQLRIKLPLQKVPVNPVRTTRGTMAHPSVSIEDAIGDLPPFDWKHPNRKKADPKLQNLVKRRKDEGIPVVKCDYEKPHCGYEGVVQYKYEPRTSYQREAREHATEDLQHFTRCLLPKTVERVVTVPLEVGADFRSLPDSLGEWQFSNPTSSVGRNRYRSTLYSRLNWAGYFPTTVTNMHPTAKQSRVLHPDCMRMVTVRELARSQGFPDWFVFVSLNNNVVTMHRQIGNAVPWQISRALGRELRAALFSRWKNELVDD
ncbi:S-adenosyl-L-methionine-dependent methyltransferase [Roridomyces roridus]|uniref:DNA (cytosine-5-)-methyltransferase n=1 Tax=Roridomyces roridus TaxID=1738132 RepID=A0AAD7B4W9_9AGAR|nr:S-adenosyl-L-methionine-dependent methyltransferase [Roridomyces roridus]